MQNKSILLNQIASCHKKNGWFVSFVNAVKGLNAEQAIWKKDDSTNSIFEIVTHLTFWNRRYLNRFKAIPNKRMEGNNDSTFQNLDHPGWEEAAHSFNEVMDDWYKTLSDSTDEKLNSHIEDNSGDTWGEAIANMAIHTAHHIGQIVYIRKLQGSWEPGQGVN
jgi:uncharacterized damage-inducible protein DinB